MIKNFLTNIKIALLGFAIDNKDLLPFLLESGAKVTILDENEDLEVSEEIKNQSEVILGEKAFSDLKKFDMISRAPGIYRYREELVEAENAGVEITSKIKIFFDVCPGKIIGVTGTKGKGTTSTLIYEILKNSGKKVFLAGNIGLGIFDNFNEIDSETWVVLELSSFQLIDLHKSPKIGVILMTTVEHQDWHKSPDEYVFAKGNLLKWQNEKDFAVVNFDFPNSTRIGELGNGEKYFFSRKQSVGRGAQVADGAIWFENNGESEKVVDVNKIRLRGEHNWENIMAASLAAKLAGVSLKSISETIRSFKGLEHRLEEVATVDGVTFFNDSFSTVPETTIAAIKSFKEPVILIAGGSEKNSDFSELGKVISETENVKAVILIGLMAERIKKAIEENLKPDRKLEMITGLKKMSEIVGKAKELSKNGDVVLLSPAAASFDMFKNYKDRGQQFVQAVSKLNNTKSKVS